MFSREECVFNKYRKSQIGFKDFIKEATLFEVSELLLLYIGIISLISFTMSK